MLRGPMGPDASDELERLPSESVALACAASETIDSPFVAAIPSYVYAARELSVTD